MTDIVSAARTAREMLAQGLAALQMPGVPPQLMDVAEPIAQAMGSLHRIESTQGAAARDNGGVALDAVRRALSMLQAVPAQHPAIDQAMEAVASSLSLVHTISAAAPHQPVASPAAFAGTVVMDNPQQHHPPLSASPATQPSAHGYAVGQQVAAAGYQQQPQWGNAPAPQQQPAYPPQQQAYAPDPQQQAWPQQQPQQQAWPQQQPQQAPAPAQQAWPQQAPAPAQQAWQQPPPAPAQQAWAPAAAAPAPAPAAAGRPAAAAGGPPVRVEAELGAHSATNFYKGLSGNDVIDSGGIFIATYQIPQIGQDLIIKVSMPGGYEFEAMGVVRWTRDMPNSGADAPPGYGAQFTQISPEGRQLVYRYVRNREPLFHDDF
jgi:hypothetical protein